MVYQGSKARLVKYLKPILESHNKNYDTYVEPFCGGANVICEIEGYQKKWAYDDSKYLITLLNHTLGNRINKNKIVTEKLFRYLGEL